MSSWSIIRNAGRRWCSLGGMLANLWHSSGLLAQPLNAISVYCGTGSTPRLPSYVRGDSR